LKKGLFLLVITFFIVSSAWGSYGIVDNSATRDTLTIICNPLDSMGNPTNLVAGDSLWLTVFFPGGAAAYRDSSDWNDGQILRLGTPNGPCSSYVWMDQIADIDGAGVDGVYTYHLVVYDKTSAALKTQYTGNFQVVTSPLDMSLDSAIFDPATDSVIVDVSAAVTAKGLSDKVAQEILGYADTAWGAATFGDQMLDQNDTLKLTYAAVGATVVGLIDIYDEVSNIDAWNPASDSVVVDVSAALTAGNLIALLTEEVWRNIDTTNIDTSLIGEWLSTGVNATLSDAAMGAIADSLVKRGMVLYSNPDSILKLRGLHVRGATANDTAAIFHGNLYGLVAIGDNQDGIRAVGGDDGISIAATDDGITVVAGDVGINVTGSAGVDVAIVGATDGMNISGSLDDGLTITGAHDGINIIGIAEEGIQILGATDGMNITGTAGDGVASIGGDDGIYAYGGDDAVYANGVDNGIFASGGGDGISAAGGDDGIYANGGDDGIYTIGGDDGIYAVSTTGQDIDAQLSDGTNDVFMADDTASLVDNIWNEDTTGHKTDPNMGFWITQGGTATISNADMGAIGDTVWLKLANAFAGTPGCIGDMLYDSVDALISSAGGVASITDADMGAIADSVHDKGYADVIAVAGGAGDSVLSIIRAMRDSVNAIIDSIQIKFVNRLALAVGDNIGINLNDVTGTLDASEIGTAAIDVNKIADNALTANKFADAFYKTITDSISKYLDGGTIDTVDYVRKGGFGYGNHKITIYAVDSTGPLPAHDTVLSGLAVIIEDQGGNRLTHLTTNSAGYIIYTAQTNDTLLVTVFGRGDHTFPGDSACGHDSIFVTTGADITDTCWGYDGNIGTPGAGSLCRMYVYVYDGSHNAVEGAELVAQYGGSNITDTTNNTAITNGEIRSAATNSSGYTYLDLTMSKALLKYNKCKIGIDYGAYTDWKYNDTIPGDVSTYRITD